MTAIKVAFLIIVVNNRPNVSGYDGQPPTGDDDRRDRFIKGGPLYGKEEIRALSGAGHLHLWSNGAVRDAQKWTLDADDLCSLVSLAVGKGRYLRSEWCEQGPNGPWAACDAYVVTRVEWREAARKDLEISYYLKFAISKTGRVLLSASNHPEGT